MSRNQSPLDNIRIASPCSADWNTMFGNDRMRFCGQCKLNVYNLSGMSRQEAEDLVTNAEGRICVRLYRRTDGTVITENCPVGWARVKARAKVYVTAAFSLLMTLIGSIYLVSLFSRSTTAVMGDIVTKPMPTPDRETQTMGAVSPDYRRVTMGNMAIPPRKL